LLNADSCIDTPPHRVLKRWALKCGFVIDYLRPIVEDSLVRTTLLPTQNRAPRRD
jgi:hypothetical protein